ncbi:MerR family DNA-binding transcriptional regulator [Amycolatopsis saalfeldensis]|uniref:MerR family regulatory protein n=1 Tax=Amycolatopsis saalfeldensis TaxID=394193 RepID=A0A1H8QJY2_9PSEU|nr:MerR family DNA-binding transcriptional regulator [Amycolatopsis saalfeldensis]SEO54550.1 MerR family regulatory protein [Amycolatopsis saalfeldensis]
MLIGELSRRTGVSPRLLRYYGEQGLLPSERTSNGYRVYGELAAMDERIDAMRRRRGSLARYLGQA